METTIDRFGRVVIPKRLRDDLGLKVGEPLVIEERAEAGFKCEYFSKCSVAPGKDCTLRIGQTFNGGVE